MGGRSQAQLFDVFEELAALNGEAISFHIVGTMWIDGHDHVVVDVSLQMYGMPFGMVLREAAGLAGYFLLRQIRMLYLTKEVPDEITWHGVTVTGLCMN